MDEQFYAPDVPTAESGATGGIVSGGSFGEMAPYSETSTLLTYVIQINPNLIVIGCLGLGALFGFQGLIRALGTANPNTALLENQTAQGQAYQGAMTAQGEALKTVAEQRPSVICAALVCNLPDQQPEQQAPPVEYHQSPEYYQPPIQSPIVPVAAATPPPVPTDPTTVEFWQYHRNNRVYIGDWVNHCRAEGGNGVGWQSAECIALSSALY